MRRTTIILLLVVLSILAAEETKFKTLDNGMIIAAKQNNLNSSVAFYIFIKTGAVNEENSMGKGLSHLLEHVLFRGTTQKRTEKEYADIAQRTGAYINAVTYQNKTGYVFVADSVYVNEGINHLVEHLFYPSFDSTEFVREKGVVAKEIIEGKTDPYGQIGWRNMELSYSNTNWKYPTIGYPELLKTATREELKSYYHKRYVPNNMVFVAVGNISPEEVLAKLEESVKNIPRGVLEMKPQPEVSPYDMDYKFVEEFNISMPQSYLTLLPTKEAALDKDALDLAGEILLGKDKTPFKNNLTQKIKELSELQGYIGSRSMSFEYAVSDIKLIDSVAKEIFVELNNAVKKGFTQKDIDNVLSRYEAAESMKQLSPEIESYEIANNLLLTGLPSTFQQEMAQYRKVKPEAISIALKKHYLNANKLIFSAVPLGSLNQLKGSQKEIVKSEMIKKDYDGFTIIHKQNSSKATIHGTIVLPLTTDYETKDSYGTLKIMTEMLLKGSKRYSAEFIQDFLADRSAQLSISLNNSGAFLRFSVHKNDLEQLLSIVNDALKNPSFDQTILDETKREQENQYLKSLADAGYSHASFRSNILYKGARESISRKDILENIKRLTVKDLKELHRKFLKGKNITLALSGDLDFAKAESIASSIRSQISKEEVKEIKNPLSTVGFVGGEYTNQYSFEQVNVDLNFPAPKMGAKDYDIARLVVTLLNGNRLRFATRGGNKDIAYSCGIDYRNSFDYGFFRLEGTTSLDKKDELLVAFNHEIQRLKDGDLTTEEIVLAVDGDRKQDKAMLSDNNLLFYAANYHNLGLGYDYLQKSYEPLYKITPKEVSAFAKKYLNNPSTFISYPSVDVNRMVK